MDLFESGLESIKNVLLGEFSKKVGSIMSQIEEEKSKLLSTAQNIVQSGVGMVQSAASAVGLESVVSDLNGDVDSFFKDVSKMTPEDLNPEIIKQKKEEMKHKIIQKTKEVLKNKFKDFGINEELSESFFQLIMSQEKQGAIKKFSAEIEKSSEGKLPSTLTQWILSILLHQK